MEEKHRIKSDLQFVRNLQSLSVVYEEIAVMKINLIKSSVLATRSFLTRLSEVFYHVKLFYRNFLVEQITGKDQHAAALSIIKKNGKEALVLLSANNKLYGDIIPKVFNAFIEASHSSTADIVIIGQIGKILYDQDLKKKQYTFFEVPDNITQADQLKPLLFHLFQYEKVTVYYGKFVSVLDLVPTTADISGNEPFEKQEAKIENDSRFLFEPDIKKVLGVFETQIFYALLKQTLHEIELARYASRIQAMEKTHDSITSKLKTLLRQEKRTKELLQNKNQLQSLAKIVFYKKRMARYAAR